MGSPGENFQSWNTAFTEEAGVCTSEANNDMIYLVLKMEAKVLILYHWGQWKKLNEEKR